MKLMVKRYVCIALMMLGSFLPAMARAPKPWLDGKVISVGHSLDMYGNRFPTATVVLYDPSNSDPLNRKRAYVIWMYKLGFGKHNVELKPGSSFKAYWTPFISPGALAIEYMDQKNHEKAELHVIEKDLDAYLIP
jgi:hypothetical protein